MTTIEHIRVVAAGTLGDGANEIWSCSMKVMVLNGSDPVAPTQYHLDSCATLIMPIWAGFITTAAIGAFDGAMFSSWVKLSYVKCSAVLASGKDDPTTNSSIVDAPVGSQGAGPAGPGSAGITYENPYPVSVVLTLTGSEYKRGSAAYGRFYLPGPNLHISSDPDTTQHMTDGLMNETVVQQWATQGAATITAINTAIRNLNGATGKVVNIGSSTDAAGVRWQPVTTVSVDNRPDTVRRRSNAISGQGRKTASV